ncbi:hypothetical protein A5674_20775 [Mycobacterium malmoense]|uniref:hypothetical protein n=1 Tax=Mycobacterium malmoense TaxID=1780 RepID=UPI00080BFFEE|nr:hypothetical protein [Mycobacterium malmoense]OCB25686.1 hypothetical protein A5674_20775 [Mycobacterium malmoense]
MGISATFNDFRLPTRILLIASFVAGLLLLTCFTLTDVGIDLTLWGWDPKPEWLKRYNADWFHSHAYIPNIFAAVTGFLIGAPVALVVLAAFTVQREEKALLDRVNRLSQLAWYSFLEAVTSFATDERLIAVQNDAKDVEKLYDWSYEILADYIAEVRQPEGGKVNVNDKLDAIGKLAPQFRNASRDLLAKVKDSGTVELEWSKVVGTWDTLNQYVRLQRLEQGLKWFDAESDARLRMWMARSKNPLQEFTDIHGYLHDAEGLQLTMQDAAEEAYIYAGLPDSEFRGLLSMGMVRFGTKRVSNYSRAYKEATNFLISLQGAVSMVEAANWPESASRRVDLVNKPSRSTLRQIGSQRTREGQAKVIRELGAQRAQKVRDTPD